ncbi:MAG: hypothetical protein M1820_006408 [Bogoriella megaspora]|nr:MAG: hypothetical protein M1820_006408 [Bogoriella megaspora]
MTDNLTLFQAFEWNAPADQRHYRRLRHILPHLKGVGINRLWIPPASKGHHPKGNGYDIYDLYDLGEFHQKGSRSTKWGPKEDLMDLAKDAQNAGIGLYYDAVLNHRCGGDATERVKVVVVDPKDRRKDLARPHDIEAWLRFDFPDRKDKYSAFKYNWHHFNASDYDNRTGKKAIFKIVADGKDWADDVDKSANGNYDYLLLNNLDYSRPDLREEVNRWGQWIVQELNLSGFRLDAVKHISRSFVDEWTSSVSASYQRELFYVGEHWTDDADALSKWLSTAPSNFSLFDAPLLYNLAKTSWSKDPDLRRVFKDSLVERRPRNAVTLVMNHDTQHGQMLDTPIKPTFVALAYSLILLRKDGYPCVFYGDVYGLYDPHPSPPTCWGKLPDLILARKLYAYGNQTDYFERKDCIGWVRSGDPSKSGGAGLAVIMSWQKERRSSSASMLDKLRLVFQRSNPELPFPTAGGVAVAEGSTPGPETLKPPPPRMRMKVGREHAGKIWRDLLGWEWADVTIDANGFGLFPCQPNSLAVFTAADAAGREKFPVQFDTNIYQQRT